MKKIYSTIMMIAMMVLGFTACSNNDDEGENISTKDSNSISSISTISVKDGIDVYYLKSSYYREDMLSQTFKDVPINAELFHLAAGTAIWCEMSREDRRQDMILQVIFYNKKLTISDFPVGHELENYDIYFGDGGTPVPPGVIGLNSGSIKVIANDGKSFTLEFNNANIVPLYYSYPINIKGTLYVENEK